MEKCANIVRQDLDILKIVFINIPDILFSDYLNFFSAKMHMY